MDEFNLERRAERVSGVLKCVESVSPVFSSIWAAYFFVWWDVSSGSEVYSVLVLCDDCIVAVRVGCIIGVSGPAGERVVCVNNDGSIIIGPDIVISRGDVRERELV